VVVSLRNSRRPVDLDRATLAWVVAKRGAATLSAGDLGFVRGMAARARSQPLTPEQNRRLAGLAYRVGIRRTRGGRR
jgi:hypothetical protein